MEIKENGRHVMGVEVVDFHKHERNTLRGFLKVKLTNLGLIIDGIAYHQKNESIWLSMPARKYQTDEGSEGWARVVFFDERHIRQAFLAISLSDIPDG
jgi:hypothetical protein